MSSTYAKSLHANPPSTEPATIESTLTTLNLQSHIEGGYFVETDRDSFQIPNPFLHRAVSDLATSEEQSATRNASTTIFYMLTPRSPIGAFHRNRGRTIHTLHWGRARYVLIHADEVDDRDGGRNGEGKGETKARIETFTVGSDVAKGEKLQWIVEGGKFKSSFLLPDTDEDRSTSAAGCLISETVIPGFDYADHDFMRAEALERLVGDEQREELSWLLRKGKGESLDV